MAVPSHRSGIDTDSSPDERDSALSGISAHTSCPGRLVFVEDGNTDGWIATDLTVELER